jgi:hypothetical protein
MIISHSRKFIFIHIHKTAGESISEALRPYLSGRDLLLGTSLRGELNNAYYNFSTACRRTSVPPAEAQRGPEGADVVGDAT